MIGLSRTQKLAASALAALLLSACGHGAVSPTGVYSNGYGQSPYGQAPYGQAPYGQAYEQGYGQNQGFYGQSETGSDPSGGYGWQTAGGQTGSPDPYLPPGQTPGDSAYDPNTLPGYPDAAPGSAPSASPSAPPAQPAPEAFQPSRYAKASAELSILTYNVWGLPSILGTQRKERFTRMGATFSPYDVVVLQETFSDDIEMVKQGSGFPYSYRHDNSNLINAGSGLTVLSKYPILTTDYQAFNQCAGKDCLVKKGILLARIDHPKLGPLDVITTHYHSDDTSKARNLRMEDANRNLQEFVQSHRSDYATIIAGDFNFAADQDEYKNLMGRLPLEDVFKALHPGQTGYTVDPANIHREGEGLPMRSDYVFVVEKPEVSVTPLSAEVTHKAPVNGFTLSDQYGVAAKLRITNK